MQTVTSLFIEAVGYCLTEMQQWSVEIFDLAWVQGAIQFFSLLGWALFIIGTVIAVFDLAIEWQNGRANLKTAALNILKGFFAASCFCVVPISLFKLSLLLQYYFIGDLGDIMAESSTFFDNMFYDENVGALVWLVEVIALIYVFIKIFFESMKRGGILFIQIGVGSLYMLSVPRGYSDGFNQWTKQVIALCVTSFLQATVCMLGIMTLGTSFIGGLVLLFATKDVPRICQHFGLDSSVHVHMTSVVSSAYTATNIVRNLASAAR